MYHRIKDVDNFQGKAKRLASVLMHLRDRNGDQYFDAQDVFKSLELDNEDKDSILYFLNRGEIIESTDNLKAIKLSRYGEFIHRGFIRNGYVPFA